MKRALAILALILVGAGLFVAFAHPVAIAEYRGSDLFGNLSEGANLHGGLMNKYPLDAYAIDTHIDTGLTPGDSWGAEIASFAAAQLWDVTRFLVKTVIGLFVMAFNLDLLNGRGGALRPVGDGIRRLHEDVLGSVWMQVALSIGGFVLMRKAFLERKHAEAASSLLTSFAFVLIALMLVYKPEATVGQVSQWTNTLSVAFLSGTNDGDLTKIDDARENVADELFKTYVVQPWAVLEFGGLKHCVNSRITDEDGFPKPVAPDDPTRTSCRNHMKVVNGRGGYAPRFLKYGSGSDERNAEYEALKDGEVPTGEPQFSGYHVDKADSPAVDIQQQGGAFSRLTCSVIIFLSALGTIALLAFLAIAVILAGIIALLLLAFTPVMLLAALVGARGHELFKAWGGKLFTALIIKAFYSLVLSCLVVVSAGIAAGTTSIGWLFAFALQGIFSWIILLKRKDLSGALMSRREHSKLESHAASRYEKVQTVAVAAVTTPVAALAGRVKGREDAQQSALKLDPNNSNGNTPNTPAGKTGSDQGNGRVDTKPGATVEQPAAASIPAVDGKQYQPPAAPGRASDVPADYEPGPVTPDARPVHEASRAAAQGDPVAPPVQDPPRAPDKPQEPARRPDAPAPLTDTPPEPRPQPRSSERTSHEPPPRIREP